MRRKEYKKRSLGRLPLKIGDSEVAVRLYSQFHNSSYWFVFLLQCRSIQYRIILCFFFFIFEFVIISISFYSTNECIIYIYIYMAMLMICMVGHQSLQRITSLLLFRFNLVQEAKKGSYIWLDERTNERIKSQTKYICEDTGNHIYTYVVCCVYIVQQ